MNAPVLAGIGVATHCENEPARAIEPLDLALAAVGKIARAIGADCAMSLLASVGLPQQTPTHEVFPRSRQRLSPGRSAVAGETPVLMPEDGRPRKA